MKHLIGAALLLSSTTAAVADEKIEVCGDAIDWPPYTYLTRDGVRGVDADILDHILGKNDISYKLSVTAWSRCLRDAAIGNTYQMAVSATHSAHRASQFIYTDWYYEVTPFYLYSKKTFPGGLNIKSIDDLKGYKVCGIHGYNYSDFGLENIDQNSVEVSEALNEVRLNRCDVFLSWKEILLGLGLVTENDFHRYAVIAAPVPNMDRHKFYFLISRAYPQAQALKTLIDREIQQLKESGKLQRIINKYLKR
ncbi:substrate-binding periplasmic protein [Vibrio sonorensis]|uniref:substrate-binding periplasmic protein n=1 Tax=Vibrio sonorensis TaxID=1004316 RepID=UPI0008D91252|nr:transporter substrate-binding domain-containing protein [Vibrio sonorensis]